MKRYLNCFGLWGGILVWWALTGLTVHAAITLSLFGNDGSPGVYGGDVVYGSVTWSATEGSAQFDIELDPTFKIFGFNFNTTIPSSDFAISVNSGGWTYRGLNTPEGIGTDLFDYSLYTNVPGHSNTLSFQVTGVNISQETDFFRPNLLPSNPIDWDAILHRSHFAAFASDSRGIIYHLSDSDHRLETGGVVPEPASLVIWGGIGIAGLVSAWRRKHLRHS